ncbi:MAG: GDP-mannose 4,6-dehydratase [Candidatus Cloacimonetes bacterium]|nr:GDP-mannose 4,6-dehydratase [Candidatus Cloacimonadota bacterium]
MQKRALITGISGQDGSYLAEFLLSKGYEVHGLVRRESLEVSGGREDNLSSVRNRVILHQGSIVDHLSLYRCIKDVQPDECYHLAAASFVHYGFEEEFQVMNSNFSATHYLLASILELRPQCRFFYAGSSEMFGKPDFAPQNETSGFSPRSIYGISKVASHHLLQNYRSREGLFACTGFLYNHESPRRARHFVTRKITRGVARIAKGLDKTLKLGNLDAVRDWGYAPDFIQGMWMMLQANEPRDYILATGKTHSVKDFLEIAFSTLELDWKQFVETDPKFFRESDPIPLIGDPSRVYQELGWKAQKPLTEIIREMVLADFQTVL